MTFSTGQVGNIGRVFWDLTLQDVDIQAAMSPGSIVPMNKINKAILFLRKALANGQKRYIDELENEAAEIDLSLWDLRHARSKERIEDLSEGFQGRHLWFYPAREEKP